jgi:hypothetical protein
VIIPKIGAFVANYRSAYVDAQQNIIYPPQKTIAFNRQLNKSDGLLTAYVSEQKQVSYSAAEQIVGQWANEVLLSLDRHKSYIINNIGRLYKDLYNNILFEPFNQCTFLLDTYGLPSVDIEPVARLKATSNLVSKPETEKAVIDINKTKRRRIKLALAAIIPLLLVSILGLALLISQTQSNTGKFDAASIIPSIKQLFTVDVEQPVNIEQPAVVEQSAVVEQPAIDSPQSTIVEPPTVSSQATIVVEPSAVNHQQATVAAQPSVATQPAAVAVAPKTATETTTETITETKKLADGMPANAFISVGSFRSEQNADAMVNMATFNGYIAIKTNANSSGFYTVLVASNKNRIKEDLQAIKNELNKGAYIFCQNCSH